MNCRKSHSKAEHSRDLKLQKSSEAAVNSVHKLGLDNQGDDQKRDHTKADHETHGSEELNWHFGVHGVDCKGNGDQGCGGSSLDDGGLIILSGEASNHPGLAEGESEEQDQVEWSLSSEAAHDHEHEHDGTDASSDGDWPSISHHPVGELLVGFYQ